MKNLVSYPSTMFSLKSGNIFEHYRTKTQQIAVFLTTNNRLTNTTAVSAAQVLFTIFIPTAIPEAGQTEQLLLLTQPSLYYVSAFLDFLRPTHYVSIDAVVNVRKNYHFFEPNHLVLLLT